MLLFLIFAAIGATASILFSIMRGEINIFPLIGSPIIWAIVKIGLWVFAWQTTGMTVKISFMLIVLTVSVAIIAFIIALINDDGGALGVSLCCIPLIILNGIICGVALVPSIGWRIAILTIVFALIIWGIAHLSEDEKSGNTAGNASGGGSGGFAVSYGDHGEIVKYYSSRREYRQSKRRHQLEDDTYSDWG